MQQKSTHPFFHANNCPSPPSLSCRSGLWSSRYTSARSHEWGEVYIWIHSALLMPRRPPANRRLITHLSTEWTLEWSTAPLLRYTDTQKFRCAYKQRQSWTHSSYKAIKVWLFYFALRILNQYSGILVYFVKLFNLCPLICISKLMESDVIQRFYLNTFSTLNLLWYPHKRLSVVLVWFVELWDISRISQHAPVW